ncbi:MAG: S41 family peptidase [Candidatus Omnitrophota bacterium]
MRRKFLASIIILAIIFAVSTVVAVSEIEKKKKEELFKQIEIFSDGLAIVQSDYVDRVDSKLLIYGALKGMLASLDPYSQFMDAQEYNELKVETEGKFGGVGIEISMRDGLLTVISPLEDTPAWKAGIKANDRIVKINNEITRGMSLTESVKKMRGKPKEQVILTIYRESEKKILEFKIIREMIKIKDLKETRILEDGIAYVRLSEFRETTPQDLDKALGILAKEGMNALILDLRNNPGGLLDMAVKVAERFIERGKLVVYTKGREGKQNMEFISRGNNPMLEMPMAVLINEGSASGSEIVAGCLQDYKRAMVIGMKSFGKGSVQTVIPLSDGSAIRLTTSKYFTPSGKVIHEEGVLPDIAVEPGKTQAQNPAEKKIEKQEEIFEKLENSTQIDLPEKPIERVAKEEKAAFDYKADAQLMRAVDVLKAIKFYSQAKK